MSDLLVRPEIFRNRIEKFGYEYQSSVVRRLAHGRRYDRADISGMDPLSFVTIFMLGQLYTMFTPKAIFLGGPSRLIGESDRAPPILFPLRL